MTTTDRTENQIEVPTEAIQPDALNHLVLNCSDLARSHKFWTEVVGFKQIAQIPTDSDTPRARFYVGAAGTGHHDFALFQVNGMEPLPTREEWSMMGVDVGVNHIAIKYHDRDAWLKQIAFLQNKGVKFHVRTEHGMTHSAYISDPDNYGIEILSEVPREKWEGDPGAAVVWSRRGPTEGPEALNDNTDYEVFGPTSS